MGMSKFIYTKENVSIDDMQKIINEFPDNWFIFGEGKNRNKKPIRQAWGWSTIVDVSLPWNNWKDEDYGLGTVGVVVIGGSFSEIVGYFIDEKLREIGYTILKTHISY
jgi:hypothetical protein